MGEPQKFPILYGKTVLNSRNNKNKSGHTSTERDVCVFNLTSKERGGGRARMNIFARVERGDLQCRREEKQFMNFAPTTVNINTEWSLN